tara:strand:+ start:109 stop:396 length:288 start_codon:yes stop_codon:yes gene_type:complete
VGRCSGYFQSSIAQLVEQVTVNHPVPGSSPGGGVLNSKKTMYNDLNEFDKAVYDFGKKVEMICAMEFAGKLDAECAYQNIKYELKVLKKVRKEYK